MAIPSFYEPNIKSGASVYTLSEESSKHCAQVLRMQQGDALVLINGIGDQFKASITEAHKKNTIVRIESHAFIQRHLQKITLGIALLKNAVRLEWLFEKATEMGIDTIVPLICERTIHERFKMDRMQNILQSAMIQSQQAWLPTLVAPISFTSFLEKYKASQQLIAHCEQGEKQSVKDIEATNDIILLIGPEGDFSPAEIALALDQTYQAIHLGSTRLRTETAGIFALSVLKNF